mmetsp:Transcript_65791/g.116593  ORF Transcript_65791/g.116593 Transcript_65791/m.116593 type:complete len:2178 (+) Transcript_65791:101-6634(+)|eukprot:CAMPEP_0197624594 /NCGR_PEP_ID=MMETSP1338-20131121/4170_1 /TAXON_ID=43686 ORGANISM="Pelagodinium beii, Strain RCC1491" /NCGR_SAMPLE_ID=MMETSP1338 /ASSEMBLY_ACC=CAM_ASM_000754 /LENGTH=2177 /DNA_ID=CAMNT_0043194753 /DNA_START=95 /DNA_END=6628 /DNA_ORIENTATION=+
MGEDIGHECGFGLLRLLKPPEYYVEKYGTQFFGVNRMHLLMEKQRNRGQDGAGVANVKLDMPPGTRYIHCEKSIAADPIGELFGRVEKQATAMLQKAPKEARLPTGPSGTEQVDPRWVKDNIPFCGELYLAHVRYGTDSENSIDRCHPVTRESNWMTRNLILAGNFNITNNEDLFGSLVQLGQHPRELSDTVMLLEKIGHFVDKENNDLYVKYSAAGHNPQTCFSLIAENLNIARILRRASGLWDGGYCIAGLMGHGDSFVMRDPSGIRPAFYYADDEIITVCSEAPLIQTVFGVPEGSVKPLPPGQALCIKRSGALTIEQILEPLALKQCSFERIYFSRGNDAGVYREREELGRLLLPPLLEMLEKGGDSLQTTVLSFVPNTSELAFLGLAKEAQDHLDRLKEAAFKELAARCAAGNSPAPGSPENVKLAELLKAKVRMEKVVHKDAKIRTFIQEDSSREHLTMHAYDVHYGTIRRGQDVVVALDDSIVRGNTLKNAILRTLDKMNPTKIIIVSSCPQIRFPDVYGIDMAKLGDLAAFKAAISLLKDRNMEHVVNDVYRKCREELKAPLNSGTIVNHVKEIFEHFTPEEISLRIAADVTPDDCKASVQILYQTVEDLHRALPDHSGDWYFTGNYPTPGGARVCCRAFALWMEGSSQRCYGINSALSFLRARRPALVLGSGAREHALAWKLCRSSEVSCVFVAPGNGGIANMNDKGDDGERFDQAPMIGVDIPIRAPHFKEVVNCCRENDVGLVVVGPEQMLADGLADKLRAEDIPVFGPSSAAAEIESSKAFAKDFMKRHKIPTAEYQNFSGGPAGLQAALDYIDSAPFEVVVKASGLAAGKGVVVPENKDEAKKAVRDCMERSVFGSAGHELVIEQRMHGPECSVFALSDGHRIAVLPPAQDHKRAHDGDRGPNTGGMGAFAPTPVVKAEMLEQIKGEILQPAIDGLRAEGRPFVGCLFAGLMITETGPKVIEFNCRFGDPETQAVLPLLACDLHHVLLACANGELAAPDSAVPVKEDTYSVSVVMASGGYPGSYEKGHAIAGLDRASRVPGVTVFHAGTAADDDIPPTTSGSRVGPAALQRMLHHRTMSKGLHKPSCVKTSGGRVLAVTAVAQGGISEARERAYVAVRSIRFQGGFYRKDIGASAISIPRPRSRSGGTAEHSIYHKMTSTYLDAGVDIEMDEAIGASTKNMMLRTHRPGCDMSDGSFDIAAVKSSALKLVSSTNGVGTKLKVAISMGRYKSIGNDLIALCANDVAARGAEPLFFSSHHSCAKLDAQQALEVNGGAADGCNEAGCAFVDAKTAEMPGVYSSSAFDLVGFAVGAAESSALLPKRETMKTGDLLVGLQSSGLHSNGFSLLRSVVQAAGIKYQSAAPFDPTRSFGDVLLAPTRIYAKPLLALARAGRLKGAAPITRGGLSRSIPRVLPKELQARLLADSWELPALFRWIAARCNIPCDELAATFNCGIGMVLIIAQEHKDEVLSLLKEMDEEPCVIGKLDARGEGQPQTHIDGAESCWLMLPELGVSLPFPQVLSSLQDPTMVSRSRALVLGGAATASPLHALLEAAEIMAFPAEVTAVFSLCDDGECAKQARQAGLTVFTTQPQADGFAFAPPPRGAESDVTDQLEKVLEKVRADLLVVLDDFSPKLLSTSFRRKWAGKLISVQASLIPCDEDVNPLQRALDMGMCVSGCTVYQQTDDVNGYGEIMLQDTARVLENDTATSLHARIIADAESTALPEALRLVATGKWKSRRLDGRQASPMAASTPATPSLPSTATSNGVSTGDAKRYEQRGVSADKGDVHKAIKNMDKGLFPAAFCKVVPDFISGDTSQAIVMHADGAGTKSSLAYMYWKKTGDLSVWKGIAQDAIVMNLDDLLCVGITDNILLSSTIGRNKNLIPGEVIAAVISGTADLVDELNRHGVSLILTGGETADVGDLVRTIIVDSTVTAQIPRSHVIDNANIRAGDIIVGLASSGRATYESCYNSGIGSNGLTAARHDTFHHDLASLFPESFDPSLAKDLVYSGKSGLLDEIHIDGFGSVTAGKLVLSPTRTYAPIVKAILADGLRDQIHGMVHCSGGAQTKVLHFVDGVHVVKDDLLPTPPVFRLIQENSGTPWDEMYKVFNMGHRLEFYTDQVTASRIMEISKSFGVHAQVIGRVDALSPGQKRVTIKSQYGEFQYGS